MNSFELNKVIGAVLASCIVLLSVSLFSHAIFAPVRPAKPGFKIEAKQETASTAPAAKPEAAAPIETRLASADANKGKPETRVCMTCHTLEKNGSNKVGPNLWGVVDRPRASHPGFDYSSAMKAKGGKWTFDELDKFLTHPQGYIPGTKMTFNGIQNPDQRANLIAYLRTQSDNPVPLPKPAATPAPSGNAQKPPATANAQTPPQQNSGGAQQPPQQAAAKPETAASLDTLLASADLNRGKSETKICMTCHTLEKNGPNKIGPNLWGVVDRPRASHPGYDYSSAMKAKGGKWTFDELDKFLTHPQGYIPGIKMTFPGIQSAKQRADLIAYLRTQSDNPVPLPKSTASSSTNSNTQKPPSQQTTGSGQNSPQQNSGSAPKPPQQNHPPQ
ncbi:MAG TPA: cytochrome c family protein [Bradyrhizobium sp.]|uniref:c-type cytochrome n=1 Tax=Bradyrhizobium sp. TaxID=376 RepID=UPI002BD0FB9D|nr:cytochrome c family protein [Bradyrhizobium sp.]HLZ01638.1 cytochrome c family protein [Bradyrhizobium sp.]